MHVLPAMAKDDQYERTDRNHKVRTYKEYHSVCPSSELGLSQPLSRQRVFPSPQKQGGGGTLACGWGVYGAYTVVLFICTYFVIETVLPVFPRTLRI
jgi:hypothetical protein